LGRKETVSAVRGQTTIPPKFASFGFRSDYSFRAHAKVELVFITRQGAAK